MMLQINILIHILILMNRFERKPVISYWKSGDPCIKFDWVNKLTEINIIHTKRLTDDFVNILLKEKHRIFLHLNITGLAQTPFEPNIPTVKDTFYLLKKLIDSGFPQKQVLVMVNPVLQNQNGLNALKLLLKLFSQFKELRLRYIRFNLLTYTKLPDGRTTFGNRNMQNRKALYKYMQLLHLSPSFYKEYNQLINDYKTIIHVDNGIEQLVGVRELMAFGLRNEWIDEKTGIKERLINYVNGNKYKPILNIISNPKPVRCQNKCLLCPWPF